MYVVMKKGGEENGVGKMIYLIPQQIKSMMQENVGGGGNKSKNLIGQLNFFLETSSFFLQNLVHKAFKSQKLQILGNIMTCPWVFSP